MLVLTRDVGEAVAIDGGRIVVTVNEIRDGRVRLGFDADPSITIDRMEIHKVKQRDKLEGRPWPRIGGDFRE
jgi:carbon storage regulator